MNDQRKSEKKENNLAKGKKTVDKSTQKKVKKTQDRNS